MQEQVKYCELCSVSSLLLSLCRETLAVRWSVRRAVGGGSSLESWAGEMAVPGGTSRGSTAVSPSCGAGSKSKPASEPWPNHGGAGHIETHGNGLITESSMNPLQTGHVEAAYHGLAPYWHFWQFYWSASHSFRFYFLNSPSPVISYCRSSFSEALSLVSVQFYRCKCRRTLDEAGWTCLMLNWFYLKVDPDPLLKRATLKAALQHVTSCTALLSLKWMYRPPVSLQEKLWV